MPQGCVEKKERLLEKKRVGVSEEESKSPGEEATLNKW